MLRNLAVSGFSTVSSDASKNCWFVLNTTRPVLISIPSNNSDGNIEAADISIGSAAPTVRADSAKKSGVPKVPGLDVITFSPDNRANLLRKDKEYYSKFCWNENSESPYCWFDTEKEQWYLQHVSTGIREYI